MYTRRILAVSNENDDLNISLLLILKISHISAKDWITW